MSCAKHTQKTSEPVDPNVPHVHKYAHLQRKLVDKNVLFNLGGRHAQVSQYYTRQEQSLVEETEGNSQ